jgi:hypothetical protein
MFCILDAPPHYPQLHSASTFNDKGSIVLEDGSIVHHQIDMFYFGDWEQLISTYPLIEKDSDFDWLDASTFAGTVHLHYVSSFKRSQCYLLSLKQYLAILGEYMPV